MAVLAFQAVDEFARAARGARQDVPGVGLDLHVQVVAAPALGLRQRGGERCVGVLARGGERAAGEPL